MSDQKNDQQDDIIATAEDGPHAISDESLEDAQGGLHIGQAGMVKNTVLSGGTTMLKLGGSNFETVYGGVGNDDVLDADLAAINPKIMPDPYGF